ncbi:MAG TPA: hypothetical protein V6D19_03285 [Stenomitos sp.]
MTSIQLPKFTSHPECAAGLITCEDAQFLIAQGWLTLEGAQYLLPKTAWHQPTCLSPN